MIQSIPRSESVEETYPFTIVRKVAQSGHVCYQSRRYFVSQRLAGRWIGLRVFPACLRVETTIPLTKVWPLPETRR